MEIEKRYYAYMLLCSDGTFYCGYTTDLSKRLSTHNSGKGAKYTRARRPVSLAYYEEFKDKSDALRREAALKKLSHKQKKGLSENKLK